MTPLQPIGVFDSGVGGLSVLQAVRHELPAEDVLYVADSGNAPYGDRSREFIEQRSVAIVEFLQARGAKAVVVACNTATGAAVKVLRSRFTLPIVAMEPAIKPAATVTRSGVVGVMATTRTLSSANFLRLVDQFGAGAKVLIQPCPGLVELVERGELTSDRTRALVESYVTPLLKSGADTLVLGCTHYSFLQPILREVAGAGITLIDPAVAVARELRRRLEEQQILAPAGRDGSDVFWTSGALPATRAVIEQLWRRGATVYELPADVALPAPDVSAT